MFYSIIIFFSFADVSIRMSVLPSNSKIKSESFGKYSTTSNYGRPPPWPSRSCVQNVKIHIRTTSLLLFSQITFLFHSIFCSASKNKKIQTYLGRLQSENSKELKQALNTDKGFKSTVIHQTTKKYTIRSSSNHLFPGLYSNIKCSLMLLFIAIHFLSTSHLLDHSSSEGSKRHIVASAISTTNGVKKNGVSALRCYVCGGNTGLPCEDIRSAGRRSPYVRPKPQTTLDGRKMFENCTDLINNKGCIKQVINGGK